MGALLGLAAILVGQPSLAQRVTPQAVDEVFVGRLVVGWRAARNAQPWDPGLDLIPDAVLDRLDAQAAIESFLGRGTGTPAFSFAPWLRLDKSLGLYPAEIAGNRATVNGVDGRGPSTPFTFDWGDGSVTQEWFPGGHDYADTSRNYTITVTANYPDGTHDSEQTQVRFVAPAYDYVRAAYVPSRVTVPAAPVTFGTTYPPYGPPTGLGAFSDAELGGMRRDVLEYVLDIAHATCLSLCNGDVMPKASEGEVMVKQTDFGGGFCLWFTDPVAFAMSPTYFNEPIGLSSFFHEMGHNITLNSPAAYRIGGSADGFMNAIISEFLAQVFQHAVSYEILNEPDRYGLSEDLVQTVRASAIASVGIVRESYRTYLTNPAQYTTYNDPSTPQDEAFTTFMTVAYKFMQLAEERGDYREPAQRLMRMLQTWCPADQVRFQEPANEAFRASLVTAAMSYAFGSDLRATFRDLNFPVDDGIYAELMGRL